MIEHSRDEARSQESEPGIPSLKVQNRDFATLPKCTDYLKAGVPPEYIPPEELIDMASRIGNSSFLELIATKSSIDEAAVPKPSEHKGHGASNRITADPVVLTETPRRFSPEKPLRAFPVEKMLERSGNANGNSLPLPEGLTNGAISDR